MWGIPNCLTIPSTSYKNYFQYVHVPLTEPKNESELSLTTSLSTIPLTLFLTLLAVSVPGFFFLYIRVY